MKKEMESLLQNDTWVITDLPKGKNVISSKWVFKTKTNTNGELVCRKARLVAKGFAQKSGIDYNDIFSPVVRYTSIRFLFSMASKLKLFVHQMDAVSAFLNGELQEEIYMKQPEGFDDGSGKVCRLIKSIYGLKQSSRVWNQKLNEVLTDFGFDRCQIDQCIYYSIDSNKMIFLAIYVDDILIFSNDECKVNKLKKRLSEKFKMKDMGEASSVLGIRVTQENFNIKLDQSEYIANILNRFGMSECNPVSTPIDINQKLNKEMYPQTEEQKEEMKNVPYMEAIGCLLFAAQNTRPDISYAVNLLSRFSTNPGQAHWTAVKRVFRYMKGTINYGIVYKSQSSPLSGYCDADWGGDIDERRSTSGYIFTSQGGPISWNTQRQRTVALSSTEAEYMSIVSAMQEAIWLQNLEAELMATDPKPITLFCDNKSAIYIIKNNNYSPRTKHVDIKARFICEKLESGKIFLEYVPTTDMLADGLTKGIPLSKHLYIYKKILN